MIFLMINFILLNKVGWVMSLTITFLKDWTLYNLLKIIDPYFSEINTEIKWGKYLLKLYSKNANHSSKFIFLSSDS